MTAKLYIGVFMLLAGTLYSCQKDEEVNKLDADYRVMTDYDPETDFSQFRSYYLADSILFIGQDKILQNECPQTSKLAKFKQALRCQCRHRNRICRHSM